MQNILSYRLYKILISLIIIFTFFSPNIIVNSHIEPHGQKNIVPRAPVLSPRLVPLKVKPGDMMTISVFVSDPLSVEMVQAKFVHENGFDIVNLSLSSGTNVIGFWKGKWKVHDTKTEHYKTIVTAFSRSGLNSSSIITWFDPVPWWDMDWKYRKMITLSSSQVPSDQNNIPLLISITDTDLRDKAQSDADDIAFTDSSGNQLNHEIEEYTSSNGELIAWVNVTSLSINSDTEIYMYYSNDECTSQENASGVWDSNYLAIWHLDETSGRHYDSTSNNHDSTSIIGVTQNAVGKISGGDSFDGSNDYIDIVMNMPSTVTISVWATYTGSTDMLWCIGSGNPGPDLFYQSAGSGVICLNTWDSWSNPFCNMPVNAGDWHLYSCVIESGNTALFIDGELGGTAGYRNPSDTSFSISSSAGYDWTGKIDEVRISSIARDPDFINTQYNNINNASDGGFYTIGSEEIALPTKPSLKIPVNNTSTQDTTPTFQWSICENAEFYTLLVDDEIDLSDGDEWINYTFDSSITSNTTPDAKTLSEGSWYWQVIVNNSNGQNASDISNLIVDTTGPNASSLDFPIDEYNSTSNQITFSWSITEDNQTNTSQVSGIESYELWIDDNPGFSSPMYVNTSSNSSQQTVEGINYWRVRAWDSAGNNGYWSEVRSFNVFDFDIKVEGEDTTKITALKGQSRTITLSVTKEYSGSEYEQVNLIYDWEDSVPSGINVNLGASVLNAGNQTDVEFEVTDNASTGTFVCIFTGDWSGFTRSASIEVTSTGMLFSMDSYPQEFDLIRDDTASSTISIEFDMGILEDVILSGSWSGDTPIGVTVDLSTLSGKPSFESTLTFTTSTSAEAGSFVYKVQGTGSGIIKNEYFHLNIFSNLTLTIETDKDSYEKGQEIHITGTARDPNKNDVQSGTTTITLSAENWIDTITTAIIDGKFETNYYITFDRPIGEWTITAIATDSHGHETSTAETAVLSVESPESYEHYTINILSPTVGQMFKRGETITFTVSLVKSEDEKIQNADIKAYFLSGNEISFSEGSPGIYTTSFDLGYDYPLGNQSLYVEAKKYENEKLKVGFIYIEFKVKSINPILELIEPKAGTIIEAGEILHIKIKASYPDDSPINEGIFTSIGPDGKELVFERTKEPGMYEATYTLKSDDIGNWTMQINIQDAFGNKVTINGGEIEVVNSRLLTNISRYWYITLAILIVIVAIAIHIAHRKLQKIKYFNLKSNLQDLEDLKKKKAIMYFSKGEISRKTYDQFMQVYERKIARLSKKYRILEIKINRNKKNFSGFSDDDSKKKH